MAKKPIEIETLKYDVATRKNILTAEFESVMREADKTPVRLAHERRNRDLDPQLVWCGKDEQDWSDLIVSAPPHWDRAPDTGVPRGTGRAEGDARPPVRGGRTGVGLPARPGARGQGTALAGEPPRRAERLRRPPAGIACC